MSNPSLHGSITVKSRQRGKVHDENIKKLVDNTKGTTIDETASSAIPVQSAYHHTVGFLQNGKLNSSEQKAYQYILDHCDIPEDFLLRKEFGGLSGISYEERLLSSYQMGLLKKKSIILTTIEKNNKETKTGKTTKTPDKGSSSDIITHIWPVPVCTHCGDCEHHWKQDCPNFFRKH